ncbi:MAG: 4Fe-4S binding protein [Treponema sp.]|nr:4Fe-4S binding protein [Treponema sp.]
MKTEKPKSKSKKISFSLKRKLIQTAAFGFCNFRVTNFAGGKIYTGKWKNFCTPGLNCYSCPGATFSCPIGAMQAAAGSQKFNFSFYAVGIILAFGIILGRGVCAFLCPFGLFQELLHKIPSPKLTLPKPCKYIKYVILLVFVLILPVASKTPMGNGDPAFCKYICPAGTLEGGIPLLSLNPHLRNTAGWLFALKAFILSAVVVMSVFIQRFFCKTLCPLGALYGFLNKISLMHINVDLEKCTQCGSCKNHCPMDVNPVKENRTLECINCGKCTEVCPSKALKISWWGK